MSTIDTTYDAGTGRGEAIERDSRTLLEPVMGLVAVTVSSQRSAPILGGI